MAKFIRGINDLETYCKNNNRIDLLEEWDYEKNKPLKPSDVCYGAGKKYWWIGKCGHSYFASLNRRTANNTGCPYCCDSHAKVLPGFNDLATTNPNLLSSWDYEKNGSLLPSMVMRGQHKKVWWKGTCGHSWQDSLGHRASGRGCPICYRESKTSFPEQVIYYYVHKCFPDSENGNTKILNGKELDIYIPSLRVGIEFDGKAWHTDKIKDEFKDQLCSSANITLFRVRDIQCPHLRPNPFVHIIDFDTYKENSLELVMEELGNELGVRFPVDLEKDRIEIYNQFIAQKKDKSLLSAFPELSKEWDYDKNGELTPDLVTPMSDKKVWWKCDKGHQWQARIHPRSKGSGCPYCNSNRLLKGFNDLETVNPEILKYWNYEKNKIQPYEVTAKSNKRVWWHCFTCDNDFEASIHNKVKYPNSCPYCSHRIVVAGMSDLNTVNPVLSKEWDYVKNGELFPEHVTPGSEKKIWWKCDKGHQWQASIYNRSKGRGCPYCSGRKVLQGYNDFAYKHPELVNEWNIEKNDCSPVEVTEHSGKKVWWKCDQGHEWQATVDSRSNGVGCPYCSGNHRKAVLNIDTNTVYKSLAEAAKACGLKKGDTISLCCMGKLESAGGYHWEYTDEPFS